LLAAIFFLVLYLIWLLPAPWRVRQIIQIVVVILGLVIPASIVIAFLVLPNSTRRFGITDEVPL
jgi:hypothetical protein